jgi:hypothetical protein
MFTYALDLAVITPAAAASGVLILRRAPLGCLIALALLVLEALLAPLIAAQTMNQLAVGVSFTPGEVIGPMAGFAVLALIAVYFIVALLRSISGRPSLEATSPH